MKKLLNVKYINRWESGETTSTYAKLDSETGKVFNIKPTSLNGEYGSCVGKFVEYPDGSIEEIINDYTIISKTGEDYITLRIHGIDHKIAWDRGKNEVLNVSSSKN